MRKLATIQKIKDITPIENADNLELAKILGWQVVIPKNTYKPGEYVIYFEIDSLLPDETKYEFLKKSSWNKTFNKIRIKTIRLRGCLSQGLIMSTKSYLDINFDVLSEGDDLSDLLGVEKYEPPVPVSLAGESRSFSWPITKTDETRIQQDPEGFVSSMKEKEFYITVKLDGTSASFIKTEDSFHVCSRNLSMKEKEGNKYWEICKKYSIREKLEKYFEETGVALSIQGEIVGPGIQKNPLNLSEHELYVFNLVNTNHNKKISYDEMIEICNSFNLKAVPIIMRGQNFNFRNMEELLDFAEFKYKEFFPTAHANQEAEGIVVRTFDNEISFKVINNTFLLKEKD